MSYFLMSEVPLVVANPAYDTDWQELLTLPKEDDDDTEISGIINGIGVTQGDEAVHWVKLTIDGREVIKEKFSASYDEYSNNGMGLNLPFENSVKIEIRDDNPRALPRF